jgi:hypothetical protein
MTKLATITLDASLSLAFYTTVRHEASAAIFAGFAVAFQCQQSSRRPTAVYR